VTYGSNGDFSLATRAILMQLHKSIVPLLLQEDGTTAVEYCVMLGLILLAMLVGIVAAGNGVLDWWNNINSEMNANGV